MALDVAGRGPLEPALKAYARELGLEDAVRFLGFVSPVQRAIEDAAIVVVPSLGEGFGMVALEAMERARPVIASAVGGLPEIVADGETGLVVPSGGRRGARRGDRRAGGRPRPRGRDGRSRARERALAEFTPERCVERVEELYERALDPTPTYAGDAAAERAPRPTRARRRRGARGGSPTGARYRAVPAKTIAASVL